MFLEVQFPHSSHPVEVEVVSPAILFLIHGNILRRVMKTWFISTDFTLCAGSGSIFPTIPAMSVCHLASGSSPEHVLVSSFSKLT